MEGDVMGRIIKPGSENYHTQSPKSSPNFDTYLGPLTEDPESYPQYITRNIAKTPASLYEMGRSLGGLGNLAELGARKLGAPESVKNILRYVAPTSQQAHEETSAILPQYMTENKPGDEWPQFAAKELALGAATGGLGRPLAFLASSLGGLAGGYLGSEAGGAIGKELGDEEVGRALGGLGGGFAGSMGTQVGVKKLRPSKALPEIFTRDKAQRINSTADEMRNFDDKIKTLKQQQHESYKQAQETIPHSQQADASGLYDKLEGISNTIGSGLTQTEKLSVMERVNSIAGDIKNKKLSIGQAKEARKNINEAIYTRNVPSGVKNKLKEVTGALDEFIETFGPEHYEHFKRGETSTIEMKQMQKQRNEFMQQKKTQIRDINKESLNDITDPIRSSIKDENKSLYNDIVKSPVKQKEVASNIEKALGFAKNKLGGAATGIILGALGLDKRLAALASGAGMALQSLYSEVSLARNVAKKYPQLFKEYAPQLIQAAQQGVAQTANVITTLGAKVQEAIDKESTSEQETPIKKGRIIRGGLR